MSSSLPLSSESSSPEAPVSGFSGAPVLAVEPEGIAAPRFDLSGAAVSIADLLAPAPKPEPSPSECLGGGRNEDTGPEPADTGGKRASAALARRFLASSSSSSELSPVGCRIGWGRYWTTRLGFPADDLGAEMEEKVGAGADLGAGRVEKRADDLGCGSDEKMPPPPPPAEGAVEGFAPASPPRAAAAGAGADLGAGREEEKRAADLGGGSEEKIPPPPEEAVGGLALASPPRAAAGASGASSASSSEEA